VKSERERCACAAPERTLPGQLFRLAKPPVILGNGRAVSLRNVLSGCAAHLAGLLIFELSAQLQFQLLDGRQHIGAQAFDQSWIAGESRRVDALHLANRVLDFTAGLGVFTKILA